MSSYETRYRVWWIPQVPMENPFTWKVSSVLEAKNILQLLGEYDIYQYEESIKPDFSNVGGLEVSYDSGETWEEWESESGDDINDWEEGE